jgi:nucleotide-binding universal stress UspA family protein
MRFTNISLVVDNDEATRRVAAQLAKLHTARLTVVDAIKELSQPGPRVVVGRRSIDVSQLIRRDRVAALRKVTRSLASEGVKPRTRLLAGDPSVEIIRDVVSEGRDLVVMTADGHKGWKRRLLGSVCHQVIRNCPIPVLIVKPAARDGFARIAVAVDPESHGNTPNALNLKLLDLGIGIAERYLAEVHIVHAWRLLGESLLAGRGGLTAAQVGELSARERADRNAAVRQLLAAFPESRPREHLLKGLPEVVVPRFVQQYQIDLLVMGSVSRTGIAGFVIGNTAERVLDDVECSVLVAKPDGFQSPVVAHARPTRRGRRPGASGRRRPTAGRARTR